MKVVVNARFLTQKITGVQRFAYELSIRLKKIFRNDIVFLAPKGIVQEQMAYDLEAIQFGMLKGYLWEQIELPFWLYSHGNPILLNLCSVAPLLYNENYTAIHDITYERYPDTFSWKFLLAYKILVPQICKNAKHIITVSNFSRKEIASYYNIPLAKFTVIYNAAGDMFKNIPDIEKKNEKYFLAVSSVKANKNFALVLQAFSKVQESCKDVRLYVIGDCKDKNFSLIDIGDYLDNSSITFLGRVSDYDLIKYYSNAIGFVFPSLYEGFGIPVIEAQSCGCPVLSSNSSSLPEVLSDSALFFEPDDIDRLSQLMLELTRDENLRQVLIQKGYSNSARFSWDDSANNIAYLLSNG